MSSNPPNRLDECLLCGIPATVTPQRDGYCEDRETCSERQRAGVRECAACGIPDGAEEPGLGDNGVCIDTVACETRQKHSDEDERVRNLPPPPAAAPRVRPVIVAITPQNPIDVLFDGIRACVYGEMLLDVVPAWIIDEVTRQVTEKVENRIYGFDRSTKSRAIIVIHEQADGNLRVEPRFSPACSVLAPHGAARFALELMASANPNIVKARMNGEDITNTAAANHIARGARTVDRVDRAGGDGDRLPPGARTTRARRRR